MTRRDLPKSPAPTVCCWWCDEPASKRRPFTVVVAPSAHYHGSCALQAAKHWPTVLARAVPLADAGGAA